MTPDYEIPNCLGEWGSVLKFYCISEVRLHRPHKFGQMFKELTQNAAGSLAKRPEEADMVRAGGGQMVAILIDGATWEPAQG